MSECKYGDTTCPCQDGDICHYEGPTPMLMSSSLATKLAEKAQSLQSQLLAVEKERDELKDYKEWALLQLEADGTAFKEAQKNIAKLQERVEKLVMIASHYFLPDPETDEENCRGCGMNMRHEVHKRSEAK